MSSYLDRAGRIVRGVLGWSATSPTTLPALLTARAAAHPDAPLLFFEGRRWTVGAFNAAVNRCAHGYRQLGVGYGDTVALISTNHPEYLFHLFGLAKLGAIASLVNPQLRGAALAHAIAAAPPRVISSGDEQAAAVAALELDREIVQRVIGDTGQAGDFVRWNDDDDSDDEPPPIPQRQSHVVAYIFTSGTTGLPKPCRVRHDRFIAAGTVFGPAINIGASDCIYNCLPLYHSTALIVGFSVAFCAGGQFALARRFSARRFFDDCREARATVAIYMGELCRYLLDQPPTATDRTHLVRRMFGAGLRADIWDAFRERFGVDDIYEFYGATEGTAVTVNVFNTPGCCGLYLPTKMTLVRYDVTRGEILRGRDGLCLSAPVGEPGLLLTAIDDNRSAFSGYADDAATRAKIVADVNKRGDRWFNSGDLLRRDHLLRLYFVDRVGDTFRFNSENVSTQEVAELLRGAPQVRDATVYGVLVPGVEGRAGMAAIAVDGELDGAALYRHAAEVLPRYAQPRFVRVVANLDVTGTFKHRKQQLADDGFDPTRVEDPLYIRDAEQRTFAPLSAEIFAAVCDGRWRL